MKKIHVFIFNTLVLLSSSIILQIIGLFFNVYISKKIGSEAVGVYSLVLSVYLFAITIASAGINIASTRVVSEELALNNFEAAKKAGKNCVVLSLITGTIACFIFLIFANFIVVNCFHNKVSSSVIYCFCVALPFISMSAAINGYFTAVRRVYKNAIAKFFEELVKIASTAFLLSLFLSPGINSVCFSLILGDVISEVTSLILLYILYVKDQKKHLETKNSRSSSSMKNILRISLPVAFTSYIRSGLSTLKQMLIPSSLEKSGIGCSLALSNYGIVHGMAMPIIMFPSVFINSFAGLLIPEFSRYYIKKDYFKIKKMSRFILSVTAIFSISVNFILFTFADLLAVKIYSNIDIAKYIKLLSFLVVFMYLDLVIDSILKGLDAQLSVVFINIADCVVTILFILIFVPKLGFIGYVFSIYISEIFNIFLSLGKLVFLLKKIDTSI